MALTRDEMEAKLGALEDRVTLLLQVVDTLESRLDRKEEKWADWALILRATSAVVEGEMRRVEGESLENSVGLAGN